jgi:hypothetical protein
MSSYFGIRRVVKYQFFCDVMLRHWVSIWFSTFQGSVMDHFHRPLDETNMMGTKYPVTRLLHPAELLNQTLGSTECKLLKSRNPG